MPQTLLYGNKKLIDMHNLNILQHVCDFIMATKLRTQKRPLLQYEHVSIMNVSCIYECILFLLYTIEQHSTYEGCSIVT